jgi:hypothetical protein
MMIVDRDTSTSKIVQSNVDAYNERDIEKFISTYAEDVIFADFPDNKSTLVGIQQVKDYYQALFDASPNLFSNIVTRITFENKVIDHESITGRQGLNEIFEIVLIYEVRENKIYKVTAIRK